MYYFCKSCNADWVRISSSPEFEVSKHEWYHVVTNCMCHVFSQSLFTKSRQKFSKKQKVDRFFTIFQMFFFCLQGIRIPVSNFLKTLQTMTKVWFKKQSWKYNWNLNKPPTSCATVCSHSSLDLLSISTSIFSHHSVCLRQTKTQSTVHSDLNGIENS